VDQELPDAAAYTLVKRFVVHSQDGSTFLHGSNLKVRRQIKKMDSVIHFNTRSIRPRLRQKVKDQD